MARNLRPALPIDRENLDLCLEHLRLALSRATDANAPKLVEKIRRSIHSCGGAQRHMERRLSQGRSKEIA